MLLILGGAPRAGKGIISRKCIEQMHFSLMSLDVLKMGLCNGLPSAGVEASMDPTEVGRRMWPLVRAMAENVLESGVDYLFEGDMLLPDQANELRDLGGEQVRTCFVGYRDIDPMQKLAEIRKYPGHPNDWLNEHNDRYVLEVVQYGISFSRLLSDECAALGLKYLDGSRDFTRAVNDAVVALAGEV